jgi:AcrR family transcriptional regulator
MRSVSVPLKSPKKREVTREAILESARRAFLSHSYDQIGVREIGAEAGVHCALVNRYFGGKLGLFREALFDETDYSGLYDVPARELGMRLARFVISGTMATEGGEPLTVNPQRMLLFIRSVGCPEALPALREALHEKMVGPLTQVLEGPHAQEKAALIASHICGFILVHRLVGAACMLQADRRIMTDQLALSLQSIIDHQAESADGPGELFSQACNSDANKKDPS